MGRQRMQQQAQQRVMDAMRAIEDLTQSGCSPQEFFAPFLKQLVVACHANAGAVWMIASQAQISIHVQEGLAELGLIENQQLLSQAGQLVANVIQQGQAVVVGDQSPKSDQRPTQHTYVMAPLVKGDQSIGAVQILLPTQVSPEAQKGLLQFIEQMTGMASLFLSGKTRKRVAIHTADFWERFEKYLADLHSSLHTQKIANVAANDARQLLAVDRVSVADQYGKKLKVLAVSGQETVNRRSNLIRRLSKFSESAITSKESFVYNGQLEGMSDGVQKLLAEYLEQAGSRMVAVIPLIKRPQQKTSEEESTKREKPKPPVQVGALILEQLSSSRFDADQKQAAELLADHLAVAMDNARSYESIFLLPVWRTIGGLFAKLRGKTLLKFSVITGLLIALILGMIFVPYNYRPSADGRLMPVIQRDAFAAVPGEVSVVHVTSGKEVKKGDLLVTLKNEQLQAEYERVINESLEKQIQIKAREAERDQAARSGNRADQIRLQGQVEELSIEVNGLKQQEVLLEQQLAKLQVKSPIDGVIATFQVDQLLENRPVKQGDVLLEVMDPTGDWHLEVEMEDRRLGAILRAQQASEQSLPVEYVLATDAELSFSGTMEEVATRTSVDEETGNVVDLLVAINKNDLPELRIGAEVKAKVDCGPKPLGYVLFGDAIDFLRIVFWL